MSEEIPGFKPRVVPVWALPEPIKELLAGPRERMADAEEIVDESDRGEVSDQELRKSKRIRILSRFW